MIFSTKRAAPLILATAWAPPAVFGPSSVRPVAQGEAASAIQEVVPIGTKPTTEGQVRSLPSFPPEREIEARPIPVVAISGPDSEPAADKSRQGNGVKMNAEGEEKAPDPIDLSAILAIRRFDPVNPPPPAIPRFKLGGATTSTPGNLTGLQAQAKAGKTALLGAIIASTLDPSGDCLGVTSENPNGLAVIHFDTEQSPHDHHNVMAGAMRRAGRVAVPAWLYSYRLADVDFIHLRRIITHEIERTAQIHGGVFCVLLDGLADFISDPNDSVECFAFISELHRLAIRFDCSIVAILHENPGSDTGKTRGHLGSQLERKAESNLRLVKDADGITTVFSERSRHAHIPKEKGSRFEWSDEAKMHVSSDAKLKTAGRPKEFEADEILQLIGKGWVTYTAALTLCSAEGWRGNRFKAAWKELKKGGRLVESVTDKGSWGVKQ